MQIAMDSRASHTSMRVLLIYFCNKRIATLEKAAQDAVDAVYLHPVSDRGPERHIAAHICDRRRVSSGRRELCVVE